MPPKEPCQVDGTRERLLAQGARLFAERGYDAMNLREVCAAARANLCAVKYYFGGKAAFYQACVRHVWSRHCAPVAGVKLDAIRSTADWRRAIEGVVYRIATQILDTSPAQRQLNLIMDHEMARPTPALRLIADEFVKPCMDNFEKLLALGMAPNLSRRAIRLRAFLVMAQIMAFASKAPMADMVFGPARHQPRFLRALAKQIASSVTGAGMARNWGKRR